MSQSSYSFFKSFSKPVLDMTDNFAVFLKFASMASLLLTGISFIFGQSFLCSIPNFQDKIGVYCLFGPSYFAYLILKLFIISVLIKVWYDRIYLKKTIHISYFKSHFSDFCKTFGIFLLFGLLNLIPIVSLFFLLVREPNPVWKIEIIYFTFVSIGFLVPFVLMRFYTNIAEMIEGTDYKNFKEIYQKTSFKMGKIMLALMFILLFDLFVFVLVHSNLKIHFFEPLPFYNIFAEFIFELTTAFTMLLFVNFMGVQKELLTKNA